MKIFKAEPIPERLKENHWNASTHRGWAIIRAENEENAISIASSEFGIAALKKLGEETPVNPWRNGLAIFTELTKEEIEESSYSTKGEEGILNKEL